MRTRLASLWEALRTSFWFVPAVLTAAAAALAFATLWVDHRLGERWVEEAEWVYTGSAEGARSLLTTLATSMITVAGVVFSITVVALTLASSQLGPRLLRNFMRDLGNQVTLGIFIATFVYCLLVVRTVRGGNGAPHLDFVPHVSVSTAIVLALASLGVLIYFIHHAATSIQASHVIAAVGGDLEQAIDRLFPETMGAGAAADDDEHDDEPARPPIATPEWPIAAGATGYVQLIDEDRLMALAVERDVVVHLLRRPGHFVAPHLPLAAIRPAERGDDTLAAAIRATVAIGPQRTLAQDVEFAIDQLVEVAVRALSPGVNDPFTAIQCVERLGAAFARLAARDIPSPRRRDDVGRLRVIAYPWTFGALLDAAFYQIRQHARTSVAVSMALLEAIASVAHAVRRPGDRAALLVHAEMIESQASAAAPAPRDRAALRRRYEAALAALAEGAPRAAPRSHELG
jgi:uncharacterized membrane protein